MEQKTLLISAVSASVGLGVGLGLANSRHTVSKWGPNYSYSSSNSVTANQIEQEMLRQIIHGRDSNVTFDKFPYYLRYTYHFYAPTPLKKEVSVSRSFPRPNFYFHNFCICAICDDNSEETRVLLTSVAYVHLKHAEVSRYTRNLAPASRTILLSGPAGNLI